MAGPSPNPISGATGFSMIDRGGYPDPFDDMASQAMPRTMPEALRWAQSIHMIDGTYAQASRRVASYFVTDVDVRPYTTSGDKKLSADDKQKILDFLNKKLRIRAVANYAAVNRLIFGNVFMSILVPFRRYLSCPSCGYEAPLEKIAENAEQYGYEWSDFAFHANCPVCKYRGDWGKPVDRRGDAESDISIKFWNPHEIEIIDDPLTDQRAFVWKIPEYYRRMIVEGSIWQLARCNWEIVQAIKHNNYLRFGKGIIHHIRDKAPSGVYAAGWGLPPAVINFRQAWHSQMLRRFNEAICQEFIVPFRVLSPDAKAGADPASSDPVMGGQGGSRFRVEMQSMIRRHRRDPGQIKISPIPIKYQLLGGEANQLAPFQLIDQATDALLNAAGVPAELYKGTLTMQAAPPMLRLFESHWSPLVADLNEMLEYIVDRACKILNWEPADAKFQRVGIADDLNRQMALLQLSQAKMISQTTALSSLDRDFKQEQEQMLEEASFVADKTQEAQAAQQAKAIQQGLVPGILTPPQGGDPSQGGAPPQSGASAPAAGGQTTPEDLDAKAQQIAQQLLGEPDTQRKSDMAQLRKSDTTMAHLVSSHMDEMRQSQNTQAGAQARQSQQAPPVKQAAVRFPSLGILRYIDRAS